MGNPANPTDGQKITFQVTQGGAGSSAITWGSGYEFSTGLPQPTLSTAAGQTDLLGFIYNAAKGKWLLAAFVNGFSSTAVTQPQGHLPAVPVDQRAVQPGFLQRAVHGRRPVQGHHGRLLVRWLLVVGVPVRAVHIARRNSRCGPSITTGSGALIPACDGDLGSADRRAVELRAAGHADPARHRRLLQRLHRAQRQLPRHPEPVRIGRALQLPGSSTGRCRRSPTSPGRWPRPFPCLRACSASPGQIPRRPCRRTATSPTTSGWISRSTPPRPPGPPTGCGRTTRPCRAAATGGSAGLHPRDRVPAVAVLRAGQHMVLLRLRCHGAAD